LILTKIFYFKLLFPNKIVEYKNAVQNKDKIKRVRNEGHDILMEWLDNSGMDSMRLKMMTKEERKKYSNEQDEKAYSAIGQLIIE